MEDRRASCIAGTHGLATRPVEETNFDSWPYGLVSTVEEFSRFGYGHVIIVSKSDYLLSDL